MRKAKLALREGDLQQAWQHCQVLLRRDARDAAVLNLASQVAVGMGQGAIALDLAQRATSVDDKSFLNLSQYASCLLAVKRFQDATAVVEELASWPPGNAVENDALGNLYSRVGRQDLALNCFRAAVDGDPEVAHHWLNLALCLQATGSMKAAEAGFDSCIELNPGDSEPWLHRSRLRTQTRPDNHVRELKNAIQASGDNWRGNVSLCYALAKELEDLGEYEESFAVLHEGATLRRDHMHYDAEADLQAIEAIKKHFAAGYFSGDSPGHDSPAPIFIVGLPRTGTTLVERILGSHSDVFAAGELNDFAECLTALVKPGQPQGRMDFIRLAASVDGAELGRRYIENTRPLVGQSPRFIDKLPLNFLYCGLIHRALPKARIIHLRRDPIDTCYAIYKTLFKQAYPFSYDLTELGNYYLAYRSLMEHWHAEMPGQVLDIEYEKLVAQPEAETRRLLEFCELPWQEHCLDFHRSDAPTMTASLAQVRRPVYSSSVGKWKHYARQLAGLARLFEKS